MTSGVGRRIVGIAAGILFLLGIRALSLVPYGKPASHAVLRLSWSARPERIEVCRELSDAELAERPAHMRLRVECQGSFAAYLLVAEVDGNRVMVDTLRGGGLRNDRPIQLVREVRVRPGARAFRVALERIDSSSVSRADTAATIGAIGDRAQRERDERRRRAAEALPPRVVLEGEAAFEAGRVVLVTYANEQRKLILSSRGAQRRPT